MRDCIGLSSFYLRFCVVYKLLVLTLFLALNFGALPAQAEVYSSEEAALMTAFPTETSTLSWPDLSARFDAADPAETSPRTAYLAAIAAVRIGAAESARQRALALRTQSETEAWRTKSDLLLLMIDFYRTPPVRQTTLAPFLEAQLRELQKTTPRLDWIAGTSLSLLLMFHTQNRDYDAVEKVLTLADSFIREQQDVEDALWLMNETLRLADEFARHPDDSKYLDAGKLTVRAAQAVKQIQQIERSPEQSARLQELYFQSVTLESALRAYAASDALETHTEPVPYYLEFFPEFQQRCVAKMSLTGNEIRFRKSFTTGGALVRMQVNKRGRAKFIDVVDAAPNEMAEKKNFAVFRKNADRLRLDFVDTPPADCAEGGEILVKLSLSWQR